MKFINRHNELARLTHLSDNKDGGLAIVYGRRRIGKTRLLLEWIRGHGGLYTVADQSTAEVQRAYFAEAVAAHLSGFAEVKYPEWGALFSRLAREARLANWRGPLVIDELPYLVTASPELPSILQRWIDHEARQAGLSVALAGSSQRMMQGLVLSEASPLFGRARQILPLHPIDPVHIPEAIGTRDPVKVVEFFAAWGGVPRYWELALDQAGTPLERLEQLVLDPLGPLHQEPDRLLIEEHPPALEVRPVLDAIGMGAARVSEIAGRIGHQATSLSRPLDRIVGMGLVRREIPFGESEKQSRRTLYRISDPFVRLWFQVVAPHRAFLATARPAHRKSLLQKLWPAHLACCWEDLCRQRVSQLEALAGAPGPWKPASRWWHGEAPEWDIVAEDLEGKRLLLGEAKWSPTPFSARELRTLAAALQQKAPPALPGKFARHERILALFVPRAQAPRPESLDQVSIVTGEDLLAH